MNQASPVLFSLGRGRAVSLDWVFTSEYGILMQRKPEGMKHNTQVYTIFSTFSLVLEDLQEPRAPFTLLESL